MINYELAKKLKDAGFSQKESEFYYRRGYHTSEAFDNGRSLGKKGEFSLNFRIEYYPYSRFRSADVKWNEADLAKLDEEEVAVPTLTELIEACGDGFDKLCRYKDRRGLFWKCWGIKKGIIEIYETSTPEEAVANLWLKLNKK